MPKERTCQLKIGNLERQVYNILSMKQEEESSLLVIIH